MEILLPTGILNGDGSSPYPTPEEYTYWKCRENRIFFMDFEVDENYLTIELCKILVQMNIEEKDIPKENLKPIYLWIHSFGGDTKQRSALMDIMLTSRIPIVTIAMGATMSSGFDIFLAGTRRYAFEHSSLLCHAGYGSLQGSQSELEEAQKNNKYNQEKDKQYILSRTDIPESVYKKNIKKDWYFTIEELEKYNICKIVKSFDEIL